MVLDRNNIMSSRMSVTAQVYVTNTQFGTKCVASKKTSQKNQKHWNCLPCGLEACWLEPFDPEICRSLRRILCASIASWVVWETPFTGSDICCITPTLSLDTLTVSWCDSLLMWNCWKSCLSQSWIAQKQNSVVEITHSTTAKTAQ